MARQHVAASVGDVFKDRTKDMAVRDWHGASHQARLNRVVDLYNVEPVALFRDGVDRLPKGLCEQQIVFHHDAQLGV